MPRERGALVSKREIPGDRPATREERDAVLARDKGVCCDCKIDMLAFREVVNASIPPQEKPENMSPGEYFGLLSVWKARLHGWTRMGFPKRRLCDPNAPLWDVEHDVPRHLGGGKLGLRNLVTRCVPCHLAKSAREAATRAKHARRSGIKKPGGRRFIPWQKEGPRWRPR